MNKRLLYGIITLLAITMVGILGFQYFWLKNTIRLETESFDRKVYDIAQRVNQQLEEKEARDMVKKDITRLIATSEPGSHSIPVEAKPLTPKKLVPKSEVQPAPKNTAMVSQEKPSRPGKKVEVMLPFSGTNAQKHINQADYFTFPEFQDFESFERLKEFEPLLQLGLANQFEINQLLRDFFPEIMIEDSQIVVMKNKSNWPQMIPSPLYKRLDSLKTKRIKAVNQQVARFLKPDFIQDCTARCVDQEVKGQEQSGYRMTFAGPVKAPQPSKSTNLVVADKAEEQEEFVQKKLSIKQSEIERKAAEKAMIKAKTLDLEMKKVMVNYFSGQKNIKERIDSAEIQMMLASELKKSGINLPFDFAVFRGHQPVYRTAGLLNKGQTEKEFTAKVYTAGLFTNDVVDSKLRLSLVFPGKDEYIIQNLYALVLVSGALSLLILTAFFASAWALLRQKKVSDIKSDFINNMTHEFKTPIATISLATDALKNPKVYQDQNRIQYYSGIIREENKRMNKQVEKVLQMAQLERKDLQLNKEPLCIHDVIQQAVSMLSLQVEDRGGKIETYFSAEDCVTSADEVHMANVFFNLIDNANKYTDTQPEIKLYTYNHQDRIIIEVTDNGKGMKPETIRHCFDKFYRESTGNRHDVKGFGLGLSYVKEIVDMHLGDIKVKSELNKGTTFEISLPLCKANKN